MFTKKPVAATPQPTGCPHDPGFDLNGNIISPRIHYGDGADQMVECLRCKKYFAKVVNGVMKPLM
jgi:hypothetical protein